jgi:hypothetical protein
MKMLFCCWHCEGKNIYSRIRNWIHNFLLVKEDPNPDPKLGRKWDPKKIVPDSQHWHAGFPKSVNGSGQGEISQITTSFVQLESIVALSRAIKQNCSV